MAGHETASLLKLYSDVILHENYEGLLHDSIVFKYKNSPIPTEELENMDP